MYHKPCMHEFRVVLHTEHGAKNGSARARSRRVLPYSAERHVLVCVLTDTRNLCIARMCNAIKGNYKMAQGVSDSCFMKL